MNRPTNANAIKYIGTGISFDLPVNNFINTYDTNPNAKPYVIEYVKSVNINVMNTGIPSVKSEKSTFVIGSIITAPRTIKTGPVANPGIELRLVKRIVIIKITQLL